MVRNIEEYGSDSSLFHPFDPLSSPARHLHQFYIVHCVSSRKRRNDGEPQRARVGTDDDCVKNPKTGSTAR